MSRRCLLLCLMLAVAGPALARSRSQAAPAGKRIAMAVRVAESPRLDGTLEDPLWRLAAPISDFRQREPAEGQAATEHTSVRILYTRRAVYFGVECADSRAAQMVATELRRDLSQALDDYFEIIIDSTHDRRNAYVFEVNALGTQRDGVIAEEQTEDMYGDEFDPGWDGVWTSAARITAQGWTATIEIPFTTLNFTKSRDVVWGINFKRFIRRKNEEDLWSSWQRFSGINKISEAGDLRGISEINGGRLFIIKPYGLAGYQHLPPAAALSGLPPGSKPLYTGGLDMKIGLRSNLVANLTGNTDFADADVDITQFNLTPYKLFFPEKRQFFLENSSIFNFPLDGEGDLLFFSRQIGIDPVSGQEVPINGGAKVTGSLGGFDLGVMDVDTRSSGPNPYANFGVVRVKRSIFGQSYIGVMGVDKRSGSPLDPYNQTGGADARILLTRNLVVTAVAAETRTPGVVGDQSDVGGSATFRSNLFEFVAEEHKIGRNFNPEVGFLERNNSISQYLDGNFKPRPQIRGVRELNFESFFFHAPDTRGVLQTQEWQATFRALFNNGAYTDDDIVDNFVQRITEPFNLYKNVYIPAGYYRWSRHQLTYGSPEDRRLTWNAYERFGSYYDGRLNEARLRGAYRANEHLSLSLAEQWNRFRLPQGNFSIIFGDLGTDYAFSRFLMFSALVQMNTANTQGASANIRLRWNYRPDSDFFIIYTVGQQFASLAAANPMQLTQHRLAVKLTYSFSP
ncbi:MAG TPA: DUF5916 domain-containing protein [Terriglobales bacterium]|nr:DUF5916 domain-containing protein [Terriglobales bacterium]